MLCLLVCVVEFLFTGVQGFINNKILPDVYFYTPFIKSATMASLSLSILFVYVYGYMRNV